MRDDVREAVSRHRWWVIFAVVLMFGYSVGKDRALRDSSGPLGELAR
jgi:hypothetical protein